MSYEKNDIVLVKSFAGPDVKVKLLRRVIPKKNEWGANGWDAILTNKKCVEKLIKSGVPYKRDEKPTVWVFDWHIIRKVWGFRWQILDNINVDYGEQIPYII